jgi:hypothetical protein
MNRIQNQQNAKVIKALRESAGRWGIQPCHVWKKKARVSAKILGKPAHKDKLSLNVSLSIGTYYMCRCYGYFPKQTKNKSKILGVDKYAVERIYKEEFDSVNCKQKRLASLNYKYANQFKKAVKAFRIKMKDNPNISLLDNKTIKVYLDVEKKFQESEPVFN